MALLLLMDATATHSDLYILFKVNKLSSFSVMLALFYHYELILLIKLSPHSPHPPKAIQNTHVYNQPAGVRNETIC